MSSWRKNVERGFTNLDKDLYERSDREFRKANCRGGRALAAYSVQRYERALNQAHKCLKKEEDHLLHEKEVILKVIRLSIANIDPEDMRRPDIVLPRAKKWIKDVDWDKVDKCVKEFVEKRRGFSVLLVNISEKDEVINEACELVREGEVEEGYQRFMDAAGMEIEDPILPIGIFVYPPISIEILSSFKSEKFNMIVDKVLGLVDTIDDPLKLSLVWYSLLYLYINFDGHESKRFDEERVFKKLKEAFDKYLDIGGEKDDFYHFHWALYESLAGKPDEAISSFEEISDISFWSEISDPFFYFFKYDSKLKNEKEIVKRFLEKYDEAEEKGRKEEQLKYLEELQTKVNKDFDYLKLDFSKEVSELKIELEDEEPKIETVKKALEKSPENSKLIDYLVKRGEEEINENNIGTALDYFEAVPNSYEDITFMENYGSLLYKSKRYLEAVKVYDKLSSKDPQYLLQVAKCKLHIGHRDESAQRLNDFLEKVDSIELVEEALKLAQDRKLLSHEKIVELCDEVIDKYGGNEFIKTVKSKSEKKLKGKKQKKYVKIEKEGMEHFRSGEYKRTVKSFSKIPEDFLDPLSTLAMAKSLYHLKKYKDALGWFDKIPDDLEKIFYQTDCCIKIGQYDKASKYCEDVNIPEEKLNQIPLPDVRGKIFEDKGKSIEAAEEYQDEGALYNLFKESMANGRKKEAVKVIDKIYYKLGDGKYKGKLEELIKDNENDFSVGFKTSLSVSHDKRDIIVCDTNVLVYKVLSEVDIVPSYRSNNIGSILLTFDNILKSENRLLIPTSVIKESDLVCKRILKKEDVDEKRKEKAIDILNGYIDEYASDDLKMEDRNEKMETYMEMARNFYLRYPEKVDEITNRKIDNNPEDKYKILTKRGVTLPGNNHPEIGDIRLLAECLWLLDLHIPGIWNISILSNDSDFLDLSNEIENELNVKVRGP